MIGTRTARAALFGLVCLFAGSALAPLAAARPPVAAAPVALRAPGVDARAPDGPKTATAAPPTADVDARGSLLPVAGFVTPTPRDRAVVAWTAVVVAAAVVASRPVRRLAARAPPVLSLPS